MTGRTFRWTTQAERDAHRLRLAHAQAELATTEIEGRKLLEAAGRWATAIARAADETDIDVPNVHHFAAKIQAALDRRTLHPPGRHHPPVVTQIGADRGSSASLCVGCYSANAATPG